MIQAIVFFPLIGALIAGLLGRIIGHRTSEYVTTGLLIVAAVLSWIVFIPYRFAPAAPGRRAAVKVHVLDWIHSGPLALDWVLRVDTLTAVMLVVVTTVSSLVHVYSIGYMADDPHRARFFAYLSLFTFAMLMLVTADNFLQMFFGWEGVGLASYLLIGFWYTRPSANAAAIKAFVVNRVGDFGFALGIFAAFMVLGHLDFDDAFPAVPGVAGKTIHFLSWDFDAMTVVCLLLFMGAMGKSAQFLLHTWLPDAMEGPTPVSALIHAATMVTAGVFMVARLSPMFDAAPIAMNVVFIVGAITAFFAATVGLVQNDIKRVIAYSTCSQLGYMFVALGAGVYSAGIFHLFTHAFFKALLFLGRRLGHPRHAPRAGHAEHGRARQEDPDHLLDDADRHAGADRRRHSGHCRSALPASSPRTPSSRRPMRVGGNLGTFGFWTLVIAACFTSFYSWRLIHLTFHGEPRHDAPAATDTDHDTHERAGRARRQPRHGLRQRA